MIFDPISDEQRKHFFRQNYGAHLPGYTGHCPTLKFRVGKRFGACTEDIMKELLEKKTLKEGPYRLNSGREPRENASMRYEKDTKADWKSETRLFRAPPYILGYTGYIPGFNSIYGLSFMRAVEEGAKEWRKNQNKLRAREEAMRVRVERHDSSNVLSQVRTDNVAAEIDHGHHRNSTTFHYEISPERPPIVGYTGHIPGARGEVALSKRYGQAAKKGLELVRKEREQRLGKIKNTNMV
ncbi:protein FAM166B-like isoform X1 [Osmia bicornis bicornis]|uniref:protein FAM166B-like isoform X1 n=2 Tax=Osmia bicornis bicornis TaxID=1437191 RepID=UPI0010F9FC68|nr:protein FAM166B-like isoform X1 [Osmia bicornis bicornis]XP_046142368.1 protein FAM166B-like isoform X1 [Osmia bicornis bicornis]